MEGILHLRLLGPVQVERDGEPVRGFRSRKALALLGYLALQGHPVPREHLVDLLWEDKSEARGRANLSWVLHKISTLLPGCLAADRHTIQFQGTAPSTSSPRLRSGQAGQAPSTSRCGEPVEPSGQAPSTGRCGEPVEPSGQAPSTGRCGEPVEPSVQAPYWLDIVAFEELEAQGDAASLAAAVELYRGELLEGMYLDDCAEFELWLVAERERWRQRVARVLEALVTHHSQHGQHQQGLRFARRLLALEPWREETHRQVMRLLAYSGQRGAALVQYETCRRVLAEELDVEPAAETTQLYEQIRDGELEIPVAPPHLPTQPPPFLDEEAPVERPVFVVRERELAQLDGFLDQALAGQGRVVFVTGDAGQGKTALIREFARRAQAAYPDLVVASGHGNAHTGIGDPYLPFREVLSLLTGDVKARWAAGAMPSDQARRLWHTLPLAVQALVEDGPDLIDTFLPGAALVKRAVASAPVRADWLPQLQELVRRKAALPPDPNLQQTTLFEQYTRMVGALASQRPLLLVLDDLQWADAASTSLLFHLGRRLVGSRVLIVGAYRPEEVALGRPSTSSGQRERHPLEPVVNEFKRHFGDIVVDLGEAEDRQFVDAFLDTEPNRLDSTFRQTLYRQTGGHPLFTVELLRGMQERGDLVQDGEGRWVEGPALDWETLPVRVEAVIAERIGRLPARLQDTLTLASIEGETFTAEVIARVWAADEQEVVRCLSGEMDRRHRLVSAQGVLRTDPTLSGTKGDQCLSLYRFRHILFQRYLYNSLDQVERAHLHQAVGTALEALYGEGVEEITVQLARHFQEAGIAEKAVDYLSQAGDRARRLYAHQEAIDYYQQALALTGDDPAARWDVLARQEQVLEVLSRREAQAEVLDEMLHLAEVLDDPVRQARTYHRQGWREVLAGEPGRALSLLDKAVLLARTAGEHDLLGTCLRAVARAWWRIGNVARCQAATEEARALFHEAGNRDGEGQALSMLGNLHLALTGDYAQALACFKECQHIAHELENLFEETAYLGSVAFTRTLLGDYHASQSALAKVLAFFANVGDDYRVGIYLVAQSLNYWALGDLERAHQSARRALELCRQVGIPNFELEALGSLGQIALDQGDPQQACDWFQQAVEVAKAHEQTIDWAEQLSHMALAHSRLGDHETALRLSAEALATMEQESGILDRLKRVCFERAQIANAAQDPQAARPCLERAHQLLMTVADRISDPDLRCSFLENVTENRAIVAAYRAMHATDEGG